MEILTMMLGTVVAVFLIFLAALLFFVSATLIRAGFTHLFGDVDKDEL